MIESTFQILPRVGAKKETALWDAGIRRWSDFIDSEEIAPIKSKDKERFDSLLNYAYELLDDGDCRGLGNMLKTGEHWRLYDRFRKDASERKRRVTPSQSPMDALARRGWPPKNTGML